MSTTGRFLAVAALVLGIASLCHGLVIGIDFGSEWMKVALVGPKTFEVVENDNSGRKTATMVAFHRGDLLVGTDASNLYARFPKVVYSNVQQLLGRTWGDPVVKELEHLFLFPLEKNEQDAFSVHYDENTSFVPEEIAGMLLSYARERASKTSGTNIKDAVITVPPFWNQQQRQAILDAAQIAGLHVLTLLNENAAAALHYGIDKEFSEVPIQLMFYDMGAGSTTATLVTFKNVHDVKKNKTIGQLQIDDVAWDQTLGSKEFDFRLAQHFAAIVKEKHHEEISVETNPRAFAKLMKEASKAKEILSANTATPFIIEGLTSEIDFKSHITREKFEELCSDLLERAVAPVEEVLKRANINPQDLYEFEVLGGGVRVPSVQQKLLEFLKRSELGKHMNGDESIVMGATFYGATQSSAFRVKDFKVKDMSPFSVNAIVQEVPDGEVKNPSELFHSGSRFGARKALTFATTSNFTVSLNYNDQEKLPPGTQLNLGKFLVSNVPTAEQYNMTDPPKIHASFRITPNGVSFDKAEAEITVIYYPEPENASEPTETKPQEEVKTEQEPEKVESQEDSAPKEPVESTEGDAENLEKQEEEVPPEEEAVPVEAKEPEPEEPLPNEPKTRVHRVNLKITPLETMGMSKEQFKQAASAIKEIKHKLELKKEKEKEKNSVEAYIYEWREKLSENEEVQKVTTEVQREAFLEKLNGAGEWLYEDGEDAATSEYRAKLKELKVEGDKIELRASELKNRPIAASYLLYTVSLSRDALVNISKTREVTEEDVVEMSEELDAVEKWINDKLEEQNKLEPHEDPVFTSDQVYKRWKRIENELKVLSRKPKKKAPKPVANSTIEEAEPQPEEAEPQTNESNGEPQPEAAEQTQEPEGTDESGDQAPPQEEEPQAQENGGGEEAKPKKKHDEL